MQISRYEAGGEAARAERRHHQHGEITTTAAAELKRRRGILGSLLVPRDVLERPPDGPRHLAEQFVGVGRTVFLEERGAPVIDRGMRRHRRHETFEARPIFRRIGKRVGAGGTLYAGRAEVTRPVVDPNPADKTKLPRPAAEVSRRHVIAEAILRPGNLFRAGGNFELRLDDLLIVVVARPQHHPVLAECHRPLVVVGRDVLDAENRHYRAMIGDEPSTFIGDAVLSTTCISWTRDYRCQPLCRPGRTGWILGAPY